MQSATYEFAAAEEVFMHVWAVPTSGDGTRRISEREVELIGSHTADPKHLDPSCSACHHLRAQMESIARTAVERTASSIQRPADFDVYSDPGSIVFSPGNGQRPCVTVSIYVRDRAERARSNDDDPVSELKLVLGAHGIRER